MNSNNKEFGQTSEQNIDEMLAGLPRVSAPPDFDLHLKARIARGRSEPKRSGYFFALKIAIPGALLASMAVFLFLSGVVTPDLDGVVAVANNEAIMAPPHVTSEQIPPPVPIASALPVPSDSPETDLPALPVSSERNVPARPALRAPNTPRLTTPAIPVIAADTNVGGGSRDMAVRVDRPIELNSAPDDSPRMSTPDQIAPGYESNSRLPVTDVLGLLGIDAVFDGGWKVRSVDAVRAGARSGIKAGDVIIALDGTQIGESSTLASGTTVRTVTVKRDDASVTIALRN